MDHAYLPVRCSEIYLDRIFVQRQIVFPSEGFADCLRSQQDSRFGRYRTFVSGMLPHDLLAAFIDVVERKDLFPDDAQQTQGKFVTIRERIAAEIDGGEDYFCIDSKPIEVCRFARSKRCRRMMTDNEL